MNDAASLAGTPRTVRIGDETHRIGSLTMADLGLLQDWVDTQFPDPFEIANRQVATGRYTTAQQQFLFRTAMDLARQGRRLIGTSEADEKLYSMEGTKELLYVLIRKAEPGFTREAAADLFEKMTLGDKAHLTEISNIGMVTSDPKAETDGTPTPTNHPSPSTGGASDTK